MFRRAWGGAGGCVRLKGNIFIVCRDCERNAKPGDVRAEAEGTAGDSGSWKEDKGRRDVVFIPFFSWFCVWYERSDQCSYLRLSLCLYYQAEFLPFPHTGYSKLSALLPFNPGTNRPKKRQPESLKTRISLVLERV